MSNLGGARPGAGRKKGQTNKLSGEKILDAVLSQCGKPFEVLLAEGYHMSILACDMPVRQNYEKMILSKVVADKHEIDHTTLGQALTNNFTFPTQELDDWKDVMPSIPVTFTTKEK
jgi:hypothetical protein